jgi:hypothetical protein
LRKVRLKFLSFGHTMVTILKETLQEDESL